jgi:hypothetical protein
MDIQLGPDSRISVSPNVYARPFGDETVLLDFARGEYFGLNDVGAEVWRGLEKGCSVNQIVDLIVERFDVERARAFGDVIAILRDMLDCSLIRLS